MLSYILGLDIGISSIGWAVLRTNAEGEPDKIENLGVRIFEKAEHPKNGASLALPRREARSARRRIRRRRHRKERIKNLFEQAGLMSRAEMEALFQNSGYTQDVYALRAEGLDRMLTSDEWFRVLLHLAQRRGYRSNSIAEASKDKEAGVLKTALSANAELLTEKGYRTVGEMFCVDPKFTMINPDGSAWRKTRNSAERYHATVTREMVEQEVVTLFSAQRMCGNPFASEELEEKYSKILFSQRNFDEGPGGDSPYRKTDLRGKCILEPDEPRAFKACYTFEYFKLLQDLNHIRILSNSAPSRPLTTSERERVIALAMKSESIHYGRLRKELSLSDESRFNTVHYAEEGIDIAEKAAKFPGMQSYHKLRKAFDAVQWGFIQTLSHEQLDEIATILSLYKADEKRRGELEKIGLNALAIDCLLPLSFSKAGHLSLCAMKKLIPLLEHGRRYDVACTAVYGDHRGHRTVGKSRFLSYNTLRDEGALAEITTPVVLRAISQTCKVVNAIIRKYGPPEAVHIELAREMSRNFADRTKMDRQYQERRAANERIMEQIEEIKGEQAAGQALEKFAFKNRNLVDTRYIARTMYNILNDYLEFAPSERKKKVTVVNGAVTDYIRKSIGVRKIREDGDLHHAVDAVIVAVATDGMIQRISNYAKRREWGYKDTGKYVDPETGELMAQADFDEKYAPEFPQPWPCFRKELDARLSPNPYQEIMHLNLPTYETELEILPVFVSRMPNRKVTGPAHKETIRSAKLPEHSVAKTALTALKLDSKGEIKDYYNPSSDTLLYEALKARLKQFDGVGKKAFAEPFHKPKRDGTPGPLVKKVKIYSKTNLSVPVNGGIADNGNMVRIDVFRVEDDGYYFVPIYTSDTVKKELPNRAVVAHAPVEKWKTMREEDFLLSLYPGDLIRVKSAKDINLAVVSQNATGERELIRQEWLLYYSGANISTGAISVTTHDRKYSKDSLGIKKLRGIQKYEVDVLGEYHEVQLPEVRRAFR